MTPKPNPHHSVLNDLLHDVNELKVVVQVLREKQAQQNQGRDNLKEAFLHLEKRVHSVENFMRDSTQRLALVKTLFKFWPVLVMTLFFCFAVGIFVDDQKVATEIADKMELKR